MAAKEEAEKVEVVEEKKEEEVKEEEVKEEKAAEAEKTEEKVEEEAKKAPEEPKELEEDAKPISGPKVKACALNLEDSTLNVMPSGRLLRTLSEGGMGFLLASVRANTGIKSGRYMFETRIVEMLPVPEAHGARTPQPKHLLRVGLTLEGSSLFLADGTDNVCFDTEGFFTYGKVRTRAGQKLLRDQTVAILVNLEDGSPNQNTVSLFVNGVRCSKPQKIPEAMIGKALFPTITYRNISLEVNLGPVPRKPLPFSCHMLGAAAASDVQTVAKGTGKKECIFPVGLPEQGYFDWLDQFLEKNPNYVELSDRKLIEWAFKSGLGRPKKGGSNDKPDMTFNNPMLDDGSLKRVLSAVAPALQRSYVVPEMKSNLVPSDRATLLQKFMGQDFTRKAIVVMGEPPKEYKDRIQGMILEAKTAKVELERSKQAKEEERKRLLALRAKKAEEAKNAKKGKDAKEAEEAKEEEDKTEDVKMEEPPKVELTDEEKATKYRTLEFPDLTERELSKSYASFTLPSKEEGFEDISYAWQPAEACSALLKSWILQKKLTQRAEDLQPGSDFKEAWTKWQKTYQDWRKAQAEYRDPNKRKAAQAKKAEAEKKKLEEEKKKLQEAGDEDGVKALEEAAKEKANEKPMEIDFEDLDVMGVQDVTDLGNGMPLFEKFAYEDWTLLSTRYELHLLLHSFKKDLNDSDRPSFGEKHLAYYYSKYFKKAWNFSQFGLEKFEDLLDVMRDTVSMDQDFLKAEKAEETPLEDFVKMTEEHRRERERRVDAGDETAKLKFVRPQARNQQDSKGGAKGGSKGGDRGNTASTGRSGGYGGGGYSGNNYSGSGGNYGGGNYSSQKRGYTGTGSSNYPPAKQPRTSYGGGYGNGGARGGGGGAYYRK